MTTFRLAGEGAGGDAIGRLLPNAGLERAALGTRADCVVILADGGAGDLAAPAAVLASARAAAGDGASAVILVIAASCDPVDHAALLALIDPLAQSFAPLCRIGAIDCGKDAADADVATAVAFLIAAESTTGQLLSVG